MSPGSLALAVACGALFTGAGAVVARNVKRASFPNWHGAAAVVVLAMTWLCWATIVGQVLGAVGLLRRGALLATALLTAGASEAADRARAASQPAPIPETAPGGAPAPAPTPKPSGRERAAQAALLAATVALVGLVAAVWVARTGIAVHRGLNDPDSLGYHLPFATTFAQTGYANQHLFVVPDLPVHFYPAGDELLSAIALALTHSVAFAAVKNLVYGALILVAAYAIGDEYDAGLAGLAGGALVLGLPVIAFSQPGEAVNDALLVFAIVGALALLAHATDRPGAYVLAGAGAGLAAGVKFSGLYPALGVGIVALILLWWQLASVKLRLRTALAAAGAAAAAGGSWYLRNIVSYGNPVPPARVAVGTIRLRQIPTPAGPKSYTIFQFLQQGRYLSDFRNGLAQGLGPLAAVVLGLWLLGVLACWPFGDRFGRALTILALLCAFGYVVTPASAWGLVGQGRSNQAFVINIHYAATALVLGFLALALVVGRTSLAWLFSALGLVAVAVGIGSGQRIAFWSPQIGGRAFGWLLTGAAIATVTVLLVKWPVARLPLARLPVARLPLARLPLARLPLARLPVVTAVAAGLVAAAGTVFVSRSYPSQSSTDAVQVWAAHHPGARVAGWVPDVALLYGPGSPNRVVTLTQLSDHAPIPLLSCPAWMASVAAGHFGYSAAVPLTMWNNWLAADPAFKLVAVDPLIAVYQVVGQPNVACRP